MTPIITKADTTIQSLAANRNLQLAEIVAAGNPDAVAAYQDIRNLRCNEYDAVRTAQSWAMAGDHREQDARSNYLLDDDLASDCAIANLDEVFPQWKDRKRDFAIMGWNDTDPRPWPKDPIERPIWLVTSGTEFWVRTWTDLDELKQRRLRERAHPSGQPQSPPQTQALDEPVTPPTPTQFHGHPPPLLGELDDLMEVGAAADA